MYALGRGPQPERVLPVGVVVRLPLDGIARARPLAHATKRLARVMAHLPESCGAEVG